MTDYWRCSKCESFWPALTTAEAFRNYRRAGIVHPNEECKREEKDSE